MSGTTTRNAGAGQQAQWLCRRNIANFRGQLACEVNAARRTILSQLVAEEEERLRRLLSAAGDDDDDDSVHRTRLSALVDQLGRETNVRERTMLRTRLVEAEDRFGDLSQRLDQVDCLIADGEHRIERQRMLIASLGCGGAHSQTSLRILVNYEDLLQTFRTYRGLLIEAMDRQGW